MTTRSLDLPMVLPLGAECTDCVGELGEGLARVPGVDSVDADVARGLLHVTFDTDVLPYDDLTRDARRLGSLTHCADHCPGGDHAACALRVGAATGDGDRLDQRVAHVTGMDCADCALKLEGALRRTDGVIDAGVAFGASTLTVVFDREKVSFADVLEQVRRHGYDTLERRQSEEAGPERLAFAVQGMDCADCANKLETRLGKLDGVTELRVDFGLARLTAVVAPGAASPEAALQSTAAEMGYRLTRVESGGIATATAAALDGPSLWRQPRTIATMVSGAALAAAFAAELAAPAAAPWLFGVAMVVGGYHVARSAFYSLRARSVDMNVLMTLAALGAAAIGQWAEAGLVMFLFSLGNLLQAATMERTRRQVRELVALAPSEALVLRDGVETLVPAGDVRPGDVVVVRPGQRLPVDGRVVEGTAAVDQSAITGESIPVGRAPGDAVFAGSILEGGSLRVQATTGAADNTIAKIIHLVEEAQSRRAPIQTTVDRFASRYTPIVVSLAAAVAFVPPLLGADFDTWFYRGLALLIIACPCALVLSTPVSVLSALGAAARRGILVKGGAFLEEARRLRAIAFDKTGTLTRGEPAVTDVIALDGRSSDELLAVAAACERLSEHPLSGAIVAAAEKIENGGGSHRLADATRFRAIAGQGVRADVDGTTWLVGRPGLWNGDDETIAATRERLESEGKTVVAVGTPEHVAGLIAVADTLREGTRSALEGLRRRGIEHVVMLTGDNRATAEAMGAAAGVDEVRAGLMPDEKVAAVRELGERYGAVAMVGDGVNDAPALAAATIGVAMGAAGTDAALETADVALMGDDLSALGATLDISDRTARVIRQNIVVSIAVKGVFLVLAPLGLVSLWAAVVADMGTSLLVIGNSLRLRRAARDAG